MPFGWCEGNFTREWKGHHDAMDEHKVAEIQRAIERLRHRLAAIEKDRARALISGAQSDELDEVRRARGDVQREIGVLEKLLKRSDPGEQI